jgi:MoaA/NifB/PqqE/SkfB family radical SAM enzyme
LTRSQILPAWGRILRGRRPFLSIEITKECPLRCPGCYAYEPEHLGGLTVLRQLHDYRGNELVDRALTLVRRYRPLHLSIVGGEPLVRWRELDALLPRLEQMNVEVQLVTSAVRPIPRQWVMLKCLHLVVSVDGLPEEHNRRRTPATYDRILSHIQGHRIIVHCTVTRIQLRRPDYLNDFARFWSEREEARRIWFSLYTPQEGDSSEERLTPEDRVRAIERLAALRREFPKVHMPELVLEGYRNPPASPAECIFARCTHTVSADLETRITPCQFGGKPVCSECGCMASAGFAAVGQHKIGGVLPLAKIFAISSRIGERLHAPSE